MEIRLAKTAGFCIGKAADNTIINNDIFTRSQSRTFQHDSVIVRIDDTIRQDKPATTVNIYTVIITEKLGWPCVEYGREGDGADQAKHIFRSLRALDEQGDGVVYARCPKKDGLSMAVYNRLIRAAAFRVIQL